MARAVQKTSRIGWQADDEQGIASHRLLMNRTLFGERFGCIADAAISLDRAQVLIAGAGHAPPISRIRSR